MSAGLDFPGALAQVVAKAKANLALKDELGYILQQFHLGRTRAQVLKELAARVPIEAVREACLERFRPILMTTMAAMLGALPLVVATGPGTELRRPLGITIIGGLLVSQALTLYTTPVIYLLLDRIHRRLWGGRSARGGRPESLQPAE